MKVDLQTAIYSPKGFFPTYSTAVQGEKGIFNFKINPMSCALYKYFFKAQTPMWTSFRHAAKPCFVFKPSLTKGQFNVPPSNWHDFSDSIHASLPKQCVQLITRAFKRRVYV